MHSTSLLLSETITPTKRLPFVRMETQGCKTVLHMQPDRLELNFEMASVAMLDLCAHGPGIAEVILSRVPAEAGAGAFARFGMPTMTCSFYHMMQ